MSDLFAGPGTRLLEHLDLPAPYLARVGSLRRLIDDLDGEIDLFARLIRGRLAADPGYRAVQQIPGVGPTLGAVFVVEIGDVHRFPGPGQLASWAGLTPKHRESDTHVHRAGSPSRAPGWCGGRPSSRSRPSARAPAPDGSNTGSRTAVAATSARPPPPGSS